MLIRRWLGLALFLFSAYWLVIGVIEFRRDANGYGWLIGLIVCGSALVGLLLAVSLAFGRGTWRVPVDSGFGILPERAKPPLAAGVMALFGAALWFIALKGLFNGQVQAFGRAALPIAFSASPLKFGLYFALWCIGGAGCMWLAWFLARRRS